MRVAVVLAGGSGRRSGSDTNKVLVPLAGVPVVRRSVEAMIRGGADAVVVVAQPADRASVIDALDGLEFTVTDGGATRQQSEANGVRVAAALGASTERDVVLVHDAARPLVSTSLVSAVFDAAADHGVAYPAIPRDHLWQVAEGDHLGDPVPRLLAAQTPQAAHASLLLMAVTAGGDDGADVTDTVELLDRFGPGDLAPVVVPGEATNLKVTWPGDFSVAESVLIEAVESSIVPSDAFDDYPALTKAEAEMADAKIALDCLATEGTTVCPTCQAAEADGTLEFRPALARCVEAKRS